MRGALQFAENTNRKILTNESKIKSENGAGYLLSRCIIDFCIIPAFYLFNEFPFVPQFNNMKKTIVANELTSVKYVELELGNV